MTSRRDFLVLACGALSGAAHAQLPPDIQAKRKAAAEAALRKVTGGAELRQGKVKLSRATTSRKNTISTMVAVRSSS